MGDAGVKDVKAENAKKKGPQPIRDAGGRDKKPEKKSEEKAKEKNADDKKPRVEKPKEVNPICTIFSFYN